MFCGLQFGLAGVGLWWMCAKVLPLGTREVRRPHTFFMGLILFLQCPMVAGLGVSAGAAEAVVAARQGTTPDVRAVQRKYAWIDWAVPGVAVSLAAAIGVSSSRPRGDMTDWLDDEAVGVRDLVRERDRQVAEDRRRRREWESPDDEPDYDDRIPARRRR